jgi:hypothetical protein
LPVMRRAPAGWAAGPLVHGDEGEREVLDAEVVVVTRLAE